jgi:hypothetical protein
MKITQELVSVLADPAAGEVHIVLGGYRITLTSQETSHLAGALAGGLEQLRGAPKRAPSTPPDDPIEVSRVADADAMQQRTRALIQHSIRDKGLSLREEQP